MCVYRIQWQPSAGRDRLANADWLAAQTSGEDRVLTHFATFVLLSRVDTHTHTRANKFLIAFLFKLADEDVKVLLLYIFHGYLKNLNGFLLFLKSFLVKKKKKDALVLCTNVWLFV